MREEIYTFQVKTPKIYFNRGFKNRFRNSQKSLIHVVKEKDSKTTPGAGESRYNVMNLWTVLKFFSQIEIIDHVHAFFI